MDARSFDEVIAKRRTARRRRLLRIVAVGVVAIATVYIIYMLPPPSPLEFWLHRSRYEALVTAIKKRGKALNPYKHYFAASNLDPKTLSTSQPPGGDFVRVGFSRDPSGNYQVEITTTDQGHFGYLGYIYSDDVEPSRIYPVWPIQPPRWWAFHDNTW